MDTQKPNYADSWEIRELLNVSKSHIDALDRSRVFDGKVVGMDNFANLQVSTVFAAIAIEAALNDFIRIHCLLVQFPYLQTFFAEVTNRFVWTRPEEKIDLLKKCWRHTPFPPDLVKDVFELFAIRNKVIHQKRQFKREESYSHGISSMTKKSLSDEDMRHMMRHHDIAEDFLRRFWEPGNREIHQGMPESELA